ncbi:MULTISPECIES: hypothetical protein [unclassified Coleofasciculus]|uniref:hypothetical protein n=1 Tax=unclassified Coleofasciculus TaxID=2692782 RepID=UPI00187EF90E|nr:MULTISPECIES: hypothetical protein [unclassified Coleofasciculus]MBE9125809.1 hypothetical protein [Coleofasciculus sp. LEGE 07081]MBE9149006.1 hypothetical protein [Coleofasciculus sp. LEGE 07092]
MDRKYQKQHYLIKAVFWAIAVVFGSLQAWSNRYNLSSGDVISYLDIGDAYLRRDWDIAINEYFSPVYSWILSFFISILNPSSYWEFFAIKFANFVIYLVSLVCFDFFLSEFLLYYKEKVSKAPSDRNLIIPYWAWIASGYTLYLWSALQWIGIGNDTPDMFVAALIYLAAAIVLRVHTRSDSWWNFIALGAVVGLGYLTKTFMFPMGFIFIGTCFFSVGNIRRAFPRVLVAVLVFALLSTPFIVAISTTKGYFTFGTTGKLNYAWKIGGIPPIYWQGDPPDSGIPKHPVNQIFKNPDIYQFETPFEGVTLPIGYDPSYWYEGVKPKINLQKQVEIIWSHAIEYYRIFLGFLIFGYLILVFVGGRLGLAIKSLIENWRLLIPACAGLGSLMLVHVRPRLIAGLVVLLFAGVFSSVRLPNSQESKRLVAGMTVGILFMLGGQFTDLWQHPGEPIDWKIAQGLNQLGIHAGNKVAAIALRGENGTKDYWARLARVTIVAELPDAKSFWKTDTATRAEVYKVLERTGAKAIIQKRGVNTPEYMSANGWQEIGNTGYYAYLFPK